VQKKIFLKKKTIDVAFTHKFENGEKGFKKKLKLSMLGSNLKKILYCKLLSFAVTVDVTTDILQTSKHNFQFRAKHEKYVKPCHTEEKYLSNDKKRFPCSLQF